MTAWATEAYRRVWTECCEWDEQVGMGWTRISRSKWGKTSTNVESVVSSATQRELATRRRDRKRIGRSRVSLDEPEDMDNDFCWDDGLASRNNRG